MNPQETPVHNHFWNKDFGGLVVANLLLTTAVYMMIPVMAEWLQQVLLPPVQKGLVMGAYGIGLFLLGPFCSYFVQRYRRNHVCELSILLLAACIWGLGLMHENVQQTGNANVVTLMALRVAIGALFGLAQMVLCSTLVIDVSESCQRTHANHAAAWFGRLALASGPIAVLLLQMILSVQQLYWVMAGFCIAAVVLIQIVKIPFRAPSDDYHSFSLDRFLMPSTWPLFLLLMAFTTVVGMVIVQRYDIIYYVMMLLGFFVARLIQRFLEDDVSMKVTIVSAMAIMMVTVSPEITQYTILLYISAILFGFSTGVVGNCFLTCFLNLSNHCQRGTSQSSYFLAWELGISLGLFLAITHPAHTLSEESSGAWTNLFLAKTLLVAIAFAWLLLVYPWYKRHKAR